MSSIFPGKRKPSDGNRLKGMSRFTELLGRDFKRYFLTNLLTVIAFVPVTAGIVYAILSSSILVLIPSCILGGMIAGPALCAMYDCLYRSFRDASGPVWKDYKRAIRQNLRQAVPGGALFCTMLGSYAFMLLLFYSASRFPGWSTILLLLFSILFFGMFFTLYWPMVILFELRTADRLRNILLFGLTFFWKIAGITLLQILYWAVIVLFFPWSALLMPLTGFWLILLIANFLLYPMINQSFSLEERIAQAFPEQAPFYETDEMWLERKMREPRVEAQTREQDDK